MTPTPLPEPATYRVRPADDLRPADDHRPGADATPSPPRTGSNEVVLTLTVNGEAVRRSYATHASLLDWLREAAGVTDPKLGCGEGVCGACAVLVDGEPVSSCIVLAAQLDGATVTTASGLAGPGGALGLLQRHFHELHAAQCGFCTPGMLVTAAALVASGRRHSRAEIRHALHGNLCRCTGYGPIVDAIEAAEADPLLRRVVEGGAVEVAAIAGEGRLP